jgi:hypothetical protein
MSDLIRFLAGCDKTHLTPFPNGLPKAVKKAALHSAARACAHFSRFEKRVRLSQRRNAR